MKSTMLYIVLVAATIVSASALPAAVENDEDDDTLDQLSRREFTGQELAEALLQARFYEDDAPSDLALDTRADELEERYKSHGSGHHQGTKHQGTKHQGTKHQGTKHQGTKHQGTKHQGTKHQGTKHQGTKHQGAKHQGTQH